MAKGIRVLFTRYTMVSAHLSIIPEFLEWYENDVSEYGIWISNKKYCDSIYYSQLNIDMLIIFLKKFNYPQNQIDFLEDNKDNLNHLLYDVAIDYKVENRKLKIERLWKIECRIWENFPNVEEFSEIEKYTPIIEVRKDNSWFACDHTYIINISKVRDMLKK